MRAQRLPEMEPEAIQTPMKPVMIKRPNPRISKNFLCAWIFILLITLAGPVRAAEMDEYPVVKLRSLDKISARTMTFEARVGSTVKFGPIYIKIQTCRKSQPVDPPEAAAFLQIWEVTPKEEAKWVFSGWMFASSPSLSSMDHPVYDVWLIDCLEYKTGEEPKEEKAPPEAAAPEAPKETPSVPETAETPFIENDTERPAD
jgi:hypothetical protein